MVGFFIKLPFKLALLPLRIARKAAKVLLASDDGASAGSSPVSESRARDAEPAVTTPPSPSPFDVQVDPKSILERMEAGERPTFLDVRQAQELSATGMIEGALHIPSQDLPRRMEELDKSTELVVYCAAGVRSLDAVMFLREKGFDKAWSLGGGLPHWEGDGGDVVAL